MLKTSLICSLLNDRLHENRISLFNVIKEYFENLFIIKEIIKPPICFKRNRLNNFLRDEELLSSTRYSGNRTKGFLTGDQNYRKAPGSFKWESN